MIGNDYRIIEVAKQTNAAFWAAFWAGYEKGRGSVEWAKLFLAFLLGMVVTVIGLLIGGKLP